MAKLIVNTLLTYDVSSYCYCCLYRHRCFCQIKKYTYMLGQFELCWVNPM